MGACGFTIEKSFWNSRLWTVPTPDVVFAALYVGGAPDRIRTCDLRLRRATLYPAELRVLMPAAL